VCCIKAGTTKTLLKVNSVDPKSIVFYDVLVLLGSPNINQTKEPVRLVGYQVDGVKYRVTTHRFDLSAEQIASIELPRQDPPIESGPAWAVPAVPDSHFRERQIDYASPVPMCWTTASRFGVAGGITDAQ
jgi:hypothetical protein